MYTACFNMYASKHKTYRKQIICKHFWGKSDILHTTTAVLKSNQRDVEICIVSQIVSNLSFIQPGQLQQ